MSVWWSETMVQGVGWPLLHFLWQGLVIAALLAGVLRLMRNGPAQYRYLAGCAALLLMALAPLVTFQLVLKPEEPPPLPVVEPAPDFTPAPVERTVAPAMMKPKIVVTATREPRAPKVSWRLEPLLPWLVAAWLAGVCGLSCRLFAGWLQVRRLRRADAETVADGWPEKLAELARRLGVNRPLRLLRTARVEVPTVIGWLRPVILLPAACLAGLTTAQLEAVLAHELAHIRRHDYLINLLQSAVETLLFYHPAVWWVSRRVREERENCCDDLVVEVCGDRVGYARALATLEELRPAPAQLALAAGGAPLLQRIRRLLGQGERSAGRPAWPLAGLLVVALLAFAGLEWRGHRVQAAASDSMAIDRPFIVSQARRAEEGNTNGSARDMDIWTNLSQKQLNNGMFWFRPIGSNSLAIRDPWGKTYVLTKPQDPQANPGDESANESNQVLVNNPATLAAEQKPAETRLQFKDPSGALYLARWMSNDQTVGNRELSAILSPGAGTNSVDRDPWGNPYIITMDGSNTPAPAHALGGTNEARVNTLIEDGRFYYEAGQYEEADARFKLALKLQPDNVAASQYTKLIVEKRADKTVRDNSVGSADAMLQVSQEWSIASRTRQMTPRPNMSNRTNLIYTSKGRQVIQDKLNSIRIDEVNFDLPLSDALDKLAELSRKFDPEGKGINFFLNRSPAPQGNTPAGGGQIDPDTGLPVANLQQEQGDVSSVKVKINFNNVRLADVLEAITKTADRPISYSLEDYGIMFSFRGPEAVPFETRTFRVDPNAFTQGLIWFGVSNGGFKFLTPEANTATVQSAIRQYFTAAGVDLSTNTGKVVIFNDRMGTMTIRATPADLDLIEAEVQILNSSPAAMRSGDNQTPAVLETRTFHVDPNVFRRGLESARAFTLAPDGQRLVLPVTAATNKTNAPVEEQVRELFRRAGVGLDGGSQTAVIWNENRGTLTIRAAKQDLDLIEAFIQTINTPVPEVNIKTKFVEITHKAGDTNGWAFGGLRYDPPTNGPSNSEGSTNSPGGADGYFFTGTLNANGSNILLTAGPVNQSGTPGTRAVTGILTDSQYRSVLRGLEQLDGVDILTAPEVTTESGRQAQIQAVDISELVNGSGRSPGTGSNTAASTTVGGPTNPVFNPGTSALPMGPTLDVTATVSADGYAVNLTLIPSVTEFIGYDNPGEFVPQVVVPGGATLTAVLPLPHFRLRQLVSNVDIWDAQTVVLFGPQPPRSEHAGEVNKNLIIFVTVTIINPDGTRYHKDEEMPFVKSSVPPQPGTNSLPKK